MTSEESPPPMDPVPSAMSATTPISTRFPSPSPSMSSTLNLKSLTKYPDRWHAQYRSFVRANASQVSSIESGLRSLTYILPGRFHEVPLSSEALHTGLTLLTAWHTHLLAPDTSNKPGRRLPPHSRYERWCRVTGGTIYSRAAALLRTVQYTQLLCEMFARRAGDRIRWRVVVVLELIKAMCRLVMSRLTGNRPAMATAIGAENQERITGEEEEPANPNSNKIEEGEFLGNGHVPAPTETENGEYRMPRTGLCLPTRLPSPNLSGAESVSSYLSSRVITSDEIKTASKLVHTLSTSRAQLAELLYVFRPVLYALLLQRAAALRSSSSTSSERDWKRNWTPWLIGLSMELASRQLAKAEVVEHVVGGTAGLSAVEREEEGRRKWGMGWWAMRGAFYENVTRGVVCGVAKSLKGKWGLDMVGVVVEDYEWLWDDCYFATATV